jgi:hypothetical protein
VGDIASPVLTPSRRALVHRLQAEAAPVRRLWAPGVRFGLWLALVATVGGVVGLSGVRPDLAQQLHDPVYLLETALLTVAGLAAALLALQEAIPGRAARRLERIVPFGLVLVAAVLWFRHPMRGDVAVRQFIATGLGCATSTVGLAALPWCALLIAVRRGAPLAPARAGALLGAAAFFMAALLMRARCPLDERLHLLVWHALPVAGGTMLSAVVGLAWLRRWRARASR